MVMEPDTAVSYCFMTLDVNVALGLITCIFVPSYTTSTTCPAKMSPEARQGSNIRAWFRQSIPPQGPSIAGHYPNQPRVRQSHTVTLTWSLSHGPSQTRSRHLPKPSPTIVSLDKERDQVQAKTSTAVPPCGAHIHLRKVWVEVEPESGGTCTRRRYP